MDEAMKYLFGLLPVAWQPYIVLLLIVLYLVTKYRKSLLTKNAPKDAAQVGFFGKVLNFFC